MSNINKLLLLIITLLFSSINSSFAQDIIHKKDGEKIKAKIL